MNQPELDMTGPWATSPVDKQSIAEVIVIPEAPTELGPKLRPVAG